MCFYCFYFSHHFGWMTFWFCHNFDVLAVSEKTWI
jgi:hypothetical protein